MTGLSVAEIDHSGWFAGKRVDFAANAQLGRSYPEDAATVRNFHGGTEPLGLRGETLQDAVRGFPFCQFRNEAFRVLCIAGCLFATDDQRVNLRLDEAVFRIERAQADDAFPDLGRTPRALLGRDMEYKIPHAVKNRPVSIDFDAL